MAWTRRGAIGNKWKARGAPGGQGPGEGQPVHIAAVLRGLPETSWLQEQFPLDETIFGIYRISLAMTSSVYKQRQPAEGVR